MLHTTLSFGLQVTDNGNYIVDLFFDKPIQDAPQLAKEILETVGVVEHGLFIGMATNLIIAGSDGIRTMDCK